ncbi:MAG: glutamine--fructose-6-phosphate transaminase (isomerizing) [Rhodospirillaceae bacterium]|nr:glutamine--fructose-6-phosphate transaminase (isomerizing) [Rhodospirillaceae bacterium]
MCGIIGIIGTNPVTKPIVNALKRLEYRGYDSAGISTIVDGEFVRRRAKGKLTNLEREIGSRPIDGVIGIGHTRWATHGSPTEENAHPHIAGQVAVVHNGIIENHQQLKDELFRSNISMGTDTDTEVVAHLANILLENGMTPQEMMQILVSRIDGAFAFVIMISDYPDILLAARRSSPLALGYGDGEMFVGSDAVALAPMTRRISYLEDGDWAVVRRNSVSIYDSDNMNVDRSIIYTEASECRIDKGKYNHFMEKEIHEQPNAVSSTLASYYDLTTGKIRLPDFNFDPTKVPKLTIVAAGTSYYAGMVAKYWFEGLARLPVEVDIASEFRYREPVLPAGGVALFISQSGESLDTLMALRYAREEHQSIISLVNVSESSIARESDTVIKTMAGPEVSVASTKAFTTQLVVLLTMAVCWGQLRGKLEKFDAENILADLVKLPSLMAELLSAGLDWETVSRELAQVRDVIYLGRGINYPIALEGALKLKELSYLHAEGYAAGEMKHGPIALLEDGVPVVMVAPYDQWFKKTASNLKEALARGARVVLLSEEAGIEKLEDTATWVFKIPKVDQMVAPILYALPVQLLAYHTANEKGTDLDQPRNLAKSVTVE